MLLGFSVAVLGFLTSSSPSLFFGSNNFPTVSDDTGYKLEFTFLFFGYPLVITGFLIFSSVLISNHTKCKKCNQDLGYKEIKRLLIEETRCSEGIIKKTTRYYKCQYCGD